MIDYSDTHLFSLYAASLIDTQWTVHVCRDIDQPELFHRIVNVLRLEVGSKVVLFDRYQHAIVSIEQILKKKLVVRIESILQNQVIQPSVTFFLPLLKKEALQEAVYGLCELGINQIQLVVTAKSRQQLMGEKEFLRLHNIMVAAAEQSKNYAMAQILPAKKLVDLIANISKDSVALVFDPAGKSFFKLYTKIASKDVVLLVGPEGGLTQQELQTLEKHNFDSCALTSTTLRAVQAVALSAGLVRLK